MAVDTTALVKTWPFWSRANAETILSSPAWRMSVEPDGKAVTVTKVGDPGADVIALSVALDDDELVLELADSALYPDLHVLWAKRGDLPQEVLLALVEKECGDVFRTLEAVTGRLLTVNGFAPPATTRNILAFRFVLSVGEAIVTLTNTRTMAFTFAKLDYLDPTHESIRALERPVDAEYATFAFTATEMAALKVGDRLVLPDAETTAPIWCPEEPSDDVLHLRSAEATSISFAAFADEALPPVPPPQMLKLIFRSRKVAEGRVTTLGDVKAFEITAVF